MDLRGLLNKMPRNASQPMGFSKSVGKMFLSLNEFYLTVIHKKGSSVNPSLIITLLIHYLNNIHVLLAIVFALHHKHGSSFTFDDKLRDSFKCPNIFDFLQSKNGFLVVEQLSVGR